MRNSQIQPHCISRKWLLLIFLAVHSTIGNAQSPDTSVSHFFTQYPDEQVYLQLDNSSYFPGDTVWYKAYITDNGVPSFPTKNLYVDWFDGHGVRIAHQTLPVTNGMATAQYALPAGLTGKKAHVVAYTRWMLNDSGNYAFHKDLALMEQTTSKPAMTAGRTVASAPELRFFPEGGFLVPGVLNIVAFKAVGNDGSLRDIRGVIRNNQGYAIDSFSSDYQGMGYFYLTPSDETAYTAEWTDAAGNGTNFQSSLPPARAGVAMEVLSAPNERVVTMRRSASLGGHYYLLGTFYGGATYLARVNLTTLDSAICYIPIGGYLDGTLTLTVLDSAWKPISERILFIRGEDTGASKGRIELSIIRSGLSARGRNQVLLSYTGASAASLSVAATDAALPEGSMTGAAGYLPFYSQLKNGPPYFSDTTDDNLDLLALTSEWKHNDWKAILTRQQKENKYGRDTNYYILSGEAVNGSGQNDQVQFLIKHRDFMAMDTLQLTTSGLLRDSSMILFDTTWVLYRPNPEQKNYKFQFDPIPPPAWDRYPFPDEPEWPARRNQEMSSTDSRTLSFADTADLSRRFGKTLQTVTVTRAKRLSRTDSLENVYESEQIRHSNGYVWDLQYEPPNTNFHFFIKLLADEVPDFPNHKFGIHPPPISKYIWLVDENPVPYEALSQGVFPQVVLVKYFPNGQALFGVLPVVAMYTKKYDFTKKEKGGPDRNEYIVTGYTQSQPYDTVSWQAGASRGRAADLRRTLYWNPSVYVDAKNNNVQLNFTNNDLGGPIRIIVEGMDENGNPIHLEKVLSNGHP